jgi:large subunit ribosomal protein L2
MAIKLYKPNHAGRRSASTIHDADLHRGRPLKRLVKGRTTTGGRNATGRITVRHRGGGAKRLLRDVDFKQNRYEIPAVVFTVEYDPSRSSWVSLVNYADGEKRYHLAAHGQKAGQPVVTSNTTFVDGAGNRFPLKLIPTGLSVFNIELEPGRGGRMARGAGAAAILTALDAGLAQLKLPSGEVRRVSEDCLASVGQAANPDWRNVRWGKAGRMRNRGFRPSVRGKVMNPVDHPHGGGEGKNPIGLKHPKTPWGKPALGVKTRRANRASDRFIVKRRTKRS